MIVSTAVPCVNVQEGGDAALDTTVPEYLNGGGTPKTLVAVTFGGSVPPGRRSDIAGAVSSALGEYSENAPVTLLATEEFHISASVLWPEDQVTQQELLVHLSKGPRVAAAHEVMTASGLRRMLASGGQDVGAAFAPPFAVCFRHDARSPVVFAADGVGLRHIYWVAEPGWAAVSTSSLVLARLIHARHDEAAIGAFALLGHYLGEGTPYEGVRLAPPGCAIAAQDGEVRFRKTDQSPPRQRSTRWSRAVEEGAVAVRKSVTAVMDAREEGSILELSGGLDSRALLAAIPAERRRDLEAVTVGDANGADLRVASRVAQLYRLSHRFIDIAPLLEVEPCVAAEWALIASARRDHSGNALAFAVLDWYDRSITPRPRLTGQNGEFARGFYYALQRDRRAVTSRRVDTLARWRLFTNAAADPKIFAPGFLEDSRAATEKELRRLFASYEGLGWLAATDEFYLEQRMRRWVGISFSAACTSREVLAPYFQPAYMDWARSVPPSMRRSSKVFGAVVAALDPELGSLPLDSGLRPRDIGSRGIQPVLKRSRLTAGKVLRKVRQRARLGRRPPRGTPTLAHLVTAHWSRKPDALSELSRLPFLDHRTLEQVSEGVEALDANSVGLLLGLQGITASATQHGRP